MIKIIGERKDVSLGKNVLINLDVKYKEIKQLLTELKKIVARWLVGGIAISKH